ncbi:Mitochondrial intermediate peptidase [Agyrium rufum]|nr:Mitochondrial intermediate peptidase [Agyrium rufum]
MSRARLQAQAWTFSRCLQRQSQWPLGRRFLLTAAQPAERIQPIRRETFDQSGAKSSSADHEDRLLRQIFDNRSVWEEFSRPKSRELAGLFKNQYLKSPDGFQRFAETTIERCRIIVNEVLAISTIEDYRGIARQLDRLSDLLCRIIDLAEFVRSTHPDSRYQNAAAEAHTMMFGYMNTLNTTTGLYEQLKKALDMPEVVESWSEEENKVAAILLKDFSQSAIDLPEHKKNRWLDLSAKISNLGYVVTERMEPAIRGLILDASRLHGMDPMTLRDMMDRRGRVHMPTVGMAPTSALRSVKDEETRKEIYIASRTSSKRQVRVLEEFLALRGEQAQVAGFSSFASMTLSDKMAETPQAVMKFLSALSQANAPRIQQEMAEMLSLKRALNTNDSFTRINAWDKDYLHQKLYAAERKTGRASRTPDFLPSFFSLGTVMQGLSRLFGRLYGIRLVPRETLHGETWHSEVRRLDVIDENEGHIAVVYCDLFQRDGKNPHPAHFTVRCSREIQDPEIQQAREMHSATSFLSDLPDDISSLTNDGMATASSPQTGTLHQLPTIALICDFSPEAEPKTSHFRSTFSSTKSSNPPTLLNLHDVQTLFHEMGHAIHSILGRTSLQCISGTRCATDFAELPSVLMEHFATSAPVLSLFARHFEDDKPLPYSMIEERVRVAKKGHASDLEAQIVMAALDQRCHSAEVLQHDQSSGLWDSTRAWHNVCAKWGSVPEAPSTSWQGFFGHLVGYGAVYYSYLFDRAIANRIWVGVFAGGEKSVDRERGERYRREVLRWGGGRNGWQCIGGVLGGEEGDVLRGGGEKAMERVGSWGVGEGGSG